jgi:hypothetical protein
MKFDLILTNPPFQDSANRKKTPHKLWIDFTLSVFDRLLADGGSLVQVSPASFASPSNVVLDLMSEHQTRTLRFDTGHHFPAVASTFSDYWIEKVPHHASPTSVRTADGQFEIILDSSFAYLPNDLCQLSLSIHSKVMFSGIEPLPVAWDYVTAHNIRRHDEIPSLVEMRDDRHPYPVFHTNRSTWWSSNRQEWADCKKVMWTRSGYTKPFYDNGELGGTDMVYFIKVDSDEEGLSLVRLLNSQLFQYIFKTAKWSGFGNERVFTGLPCVAHEHLLTDDQVYERFGVTPEEVNYIERSLEPGRKSAQ